jgi:hypothetical protein
MRKFTGWLRDLISQSSDTQTSEYLKKLTCGPIFTIVIYEGYVINGYTFYTKQQDKKSTYQSSGTHVDAYDVTSQDKICTMVKYKRYGSLTFTVSRFLFFHCNRVDAINGVVKDKFMFISIDLNHQGYKLEPFVLAKHVAQVFYVPDTTNKSLMVVIPTKR